MAFFSCSGQDQFPQMAVNCFASPPELSVTPPPHPLAGLQQWWEPQRGLLSLLHHCFLNKGGAEDGEKTKPMSRVCRHATPEPKALALLFFLLASWSAKAVSQHTHSGSQPCTRTKTSSQERWRSQGFY